jgi:hypothetical protein
VLTKQNSIDIENQLEDLGYELDQLERDNPYNQWMFEDEIETQGEHDEVD